jgi:hypothetical protein
MATLSDIRRRGTELDVLAFIREVKRQARRKLPKGAKKAHVSAAVTRLLCEGEVQPPPGIWLPPVLAVVAVRRNFGVVYHWSCPVCRQPRRFLYYWPTRPSRGAVTVTGCPMHPPVLAAVVRTRQGHLRTL